MSETKFSAQLRPAGEAVIVELHGEVDGRAEEALNAAYAEASRTNPARLILHFGRVDYINSTGIALIVGLLAQARKAGRKLITTGLNAHYTEIFHITRLSDFMTIAPDEASALSTNP
jgi:anti-anti-sigma factor